MNASTPGPRMILLGLIVVILCMTQLAQATIAPPIEIQLVSPPDYARRGEVFRGELEIVADIDIDVSELRLDGGGWRSLQLQSPMAKALIKGQPLRIPFEVLAEDPDALLEFSLELGDFSIQHAFDLSERHYREMIEPVEAVPALTSTTFVRKGALATASNILLPDPVLSDDAGELPRPDAAKATIRVHGRFVYDPLFRGGDWGADGMTVWVWNIDGFNTAILASGVTDPWGGIDIDVPWTGTPEDPYPNIYIHFEAANSWVDVRDDDYSERYDWYWGVYTDYPTLDLDLGELRSSIPSHDSSLHILSMLTRAHRWLRSLPGVTYELALVGVRWPYHLLGASYSPSTYTIKLDWDAGRDCGAIVHELGHHWQNMYTAIPAWNYCNQPGEVPPCGHGWWCWEYDPISWMEGFPDWFSPVISTTFEANYGEDDMFGYNFEDLRMCGGVYDDPISTEGFVAALLWDISDDQQDSHGVYGPWTDDLTMGPGDILLLADIYVPYNAQAFLDQFEAIHPIYRGEFWETARNCGFNTDDDPPGVVTNLTSTSHTISGDYIDPTIAYEWDRAFDDASGIDGYSILVTQVPGMPDTSTELGPVINYTTSPLAPGDWWFCIRARDRDGKWSPDYASFGPITIRNAIPANLLYPGSMFWSHPVVPRNLGNATLLNVTTTPVLEGNATTTWWNLLGENSGEASTGTSFWAFLYVDGALKQNRSWSAVDGGISFNALNQGPFMVWGGRHTLGARIDATDVVPETVETDNLWAHQWVWTPLSMSANTPVTRVAPPPREGGWDQVVDGSTLHYNCDGLRFRSTSYGNAFYVQAVDPAKGYDARLHTASTGSSNGFATPLVESWSPEGRLDLFVVNRHVVGVQYWDVGVLNNYEPINGNYRAEHVTGVGLSTETTTAKDMLQDDMVDVWQFFVDSAMAGPVSIWLEADEADGQLWLLYYDEGFGVGGISDNDAYTLNTGGDGRIDLAAAAEGWHTLAVYRDPEDGAGPRSYTLRVDTTPSELHPVLDLNQDWYRPLVPRPVADGTPSTVPMPSILYGNASATYLNISTRNLSALAATDVYGNIKIDGGQAGWLYWGIYPGAHVDYFNGTSPWFIRGGRHTLSIFMDEAGTVPELDETNNGYSSQWSWTPYELSVDVPLTRSSPSDRVGGWDWAYEGESLWYNCDGLRLLQGGDTWRAVALVPGAGADLDLRIHDPMNDAVNGFTISHAYSGWQGPEIDYVLINGSLAADQDYDLGVLRIGDVAQNYTAEAVGEASLTLVNEGTWGPFPLGAGHLMALHPVWLDTGPLSAALVNLSGSIDWGITLHRADEAFQSKIDMVEDAIAWTNSAGQGETFITDIADPGTYCLAVWKVGAVDLASAGSYQIQMLRTATDAPSIEMPSRTQLVGVYPNPFNPSTQIVIDLAEPGAVLLVIHDSRGRRVRTLVDEVLAATRHGFVWNGRDDRGEVVASGVYHARFVAGQVDEREKMVLLK